MELKMNVDYQKLAKTLCGASVPKPLSGTLSGHAAGEPFDKHVYEEIKKQLPNNTFRQYEYLNKLFTENPNAIDYQARSNLFNSHAISFLLSRGKDATIKWNNHNLFDEKQNDTADILVVKDGFFEIIDIKTKNISKSAQPPNIISAFKLAQFCNKILDHSEFEKFTINYFEIDWKLEDNALVCEDTHFACIFKSNPDELYINWAAAMQIQFHVSTLGQNYNGTIKDWAKSYLKHFTMRAEERSAYMINEFVTPFKKHIE